MRRAFVSVLSLCACADLGEAPATGLCGRLTVGPGIAFFEEGQVWQGTFRRCARIDEDGRFCVELPSAGTWGVHLYVGDALNYGQYVYLPLEIEVGAGEITPIEQPAIAWQVFRSRGTWNVDGRQPADLSLLQPPPDPGPEDNPAIADPRVEVVGEVAGKVTLRAAMDVYDPDGDLSIQTLACDTATWDGLHLNPPSAPQGDNYPDGEYDVVYYAPEGADECAPWVFVAADHLCNVSAILEASPSGCP